MTKIAVVIFVIGVTLTVPIGGVTDEEVQRFREFLERIARYTNSSSENPAPTPEGFVRTWHNSGKFQGDMILNDDQIEALVKDYEGALEPRVAVTDPFKLWPDNTVIYQYAQGHHTDHQQYEIISAMAEISYHTCVRFRERTANDNGFLYITSDQPGCFANVGFPDPYYGYGVMNLEKACFQPRVIIHELLHVIGFQHMQSSPDRDNYLQIFEENIQNGTEYNFIKLSALNATMLDIPYEYASVMHYPRDAFSKNGKPTMLPVAGATEEQKARMGQVDYVTHWDWQRVRRLYNCPEAGWTEPVFPLIREQTRSILLLRYESGVNGEQIKCCFENIFVVTNIVII